MAEPTSQLRGDLRAQDRYGALVTVVGEPANDAEAAILVLLARLLGDAEVGTLSRWSSAPPPPPPPDLHITDLRV